MLKLIFTHAKTAPTSQYARFPVASGGSNRWTIYLTLTFESSIRHPSKLHLFQAPVADWTGSQEISSCTI
jgi:hypothetical protein